MKRVADTEKTMSLIQKKDCSNGRTGSEESLRVLFCEQRIFAAIFPDIALRHGRGWCKTVSLLYSYSICLSSVPCCICTALIVHGHGQRRKSGEGMCLNSLANTFEWLYTCLSHVNCRMSY